MFNYFKELVVKRKIKKSTSYLNALEHRISVYGLGQIYFLIVSRYTPEEATLYIIMNTIAKDAKENFDARNMESLLKISVENVKLISKYKNKIRKELWENDISVIFSILKFDENTELLANKVLNDVYGNAKEERLAYNNSYENIKY